MQVDELVLDLFEKAGKVKFPVTRAATMSFGRAAEKTLLGGNKVSKKNDTYVEEGGVSDDQKEENDGDSTGCGGIAPPPYAQLSQYFGPLERAAEESGNRGAAFYL